MIDTIGFARGAGLVAALNPCGFALLPGCLGLVPKLSGGAPTAQLGSMLGYGVAYAIASLSCTVAPFLAVIGMTFKQGSVVTPMRRRGDRFVSVTLRL